MVHCIMKSACRRASLPVPPSESTAFGVLMDECTKSLGELEGRRGYLMERMCSLYREETLTCPTSKLPSLSATLRMLCITRHYMGTDE